MGDIAEMLAKPCGQVLALTFFDDERAITHDSVARTSGIARIAQVYERDAQIPASGERHQPTDETSAAGALSGHSIHLQRLDGTTRSVIHFVSPWRSHGSG